jgi:Uma2 family endonuclease
MVTDHARWYRRAVPVHKRYATYEDVLGAPDTQVAELIDGDLILSPRPASPHARCTSALLAELFGEFDGPLGGDRLGGWWVLVEPELHFGADVIVPNLAAWRRERMSVLPQVAAFTLAPDWVCEVISPSTAIVDRARKLHVYAREGIAHCWIVDPRIRTLETYRLERGMWVVAATYGGDDPVHAEPFDATALTPTRSWMPAQP